MYVRDEARARALEELAAVYKVLENIPLLPAGMIKALTAHRDDLIAYLNTLEVKEPPT